MITQLKLKYKIGKEIRRTKSVQEALTDSPEMKPASLSSLRLRKKSDTLFILGSGSSVNLLTESQWTRIRAADSLGINFWLIHPHVPDFYCFEMSKDPDLNRTLLNNLSVRIGEYSRTDIILKVRRLFDNRSEKALREILIQHNSSLSIPCFFTAGTEQQMIWLFQNYERITARLRNKISDVLFLKNASIVFATVFAYDMGFKNVVYCGVDGHPGSRYFYSDPSAIHPGTWAPPVKEKMENKIHQTMDSARKKMTADACLRLIHQNLFLPNHVKMWVGTKSSILSDWLPAWPWEAS